MSDPVADHRGYAPDRLGFASLTVSDSRTPATDGSALVVRREVEAAEHGFVTAALVRDEIAPVRAALRHLLSSPAIDVVVVSGGTGFSPRDVTVEAVEPLLERTVPGFGELFRMLSWRQIRAAAMLSRAVAGLVGERAVFVVPGSPKAVELALAELVLPEAAHLLGQVRR